MSLGGRVKALATRPKQRKDIEGQFESSEVPSITPQRLGERFCTNYECWMPGNRSEALFDTLGKPELRYDDPARYPAGDTHRSHAFIVGARADLYHIIPDSMHETMNSAMAFQAAVSTLLGSR